MLNGITTRSPGATCSTSEPTSDDSHRLVSQDVALLHERCEDLVEVQVGAADPARCDPDDDVGGLLDPRVGDIVHPYVSLSVPHHCLHHEPPVSPANRLRAYPSPGAGKPLPRFASRVPGIRKDAMLDDLIARGAEHGCIELSELSEAIEGMDLDEDALTELHQRLAARGIEVTDDCGKTGREPTSYRNGDLAETTSNATQLFFNEISRHPRSPSRRRSSSPRRSSAATSRPRSAWSTPTCGWSSPTPSATAARGSRSST